MLVAFDGTGNKDQTDGNYDTNVVKVSEAYVGSVFYQAGVGSGGWFDRIFGGLTGWGGKSRIKKAIKHLAKRSFGEPIDVVGFSRGSALAIDFCNKVSKLGYSVRCLMLFDTVASFGIAGNDINIGYNLDAPKNCQRIYHALSIHETRDCFPLTRVQGAEEVWFAGYHSDVGGGNGNVGLNSIPLCWMFDSASGANVDFNQDKITVAMMLRDRKASMVAPTDLIVGEGRFIGVLESVHCTARNGSTR